MGDITSLVLEGDLCQACGTHIGPGEGFPRSCPECQTAAEAELFIDLVPKPAQPENS